MRAGVAAAIAGMVGLAAAALAVYFSSPQAGGVPKGLPFAQSSTPRQIPEFQFQDASGRARSLAEFRGRLVLLNIWATWCAPCREEMPALDRLQAKLGGPGFEVVALSIDQQGAAVVRRFFDEIGIKSLRLYVDPSAQAGFKLASVGVPTTLLIDRAGREIGRHVGPAKWDAPEIVQALSRMIEEAR